MDVTQQPKYVLLDKIDINNGFGATVQKLKPIGYVNGYLDMLTGVESKTNNVSLEESTHVFLTTYRKDIKRGMVLEDEDGKRFEVTYVDNPVTLGHHLEIYLTFINESYKTG